MGCSSSKPEPIKAYGVLQKQSSSTIRVKKSRVSAALPDSPASQHGTTTRTPLAISVSLSRLHQPYVYTESRMIPHFHLFFSLYWGRQYNTKCQQGYKARALCIDLFLPLRSVSQSRCPDAISESHHESESI